MMVDGVEKDTLATVHSLIGHMMDNVSKVYLTIKYQHIVTILHDMQSELVL